MHSLSLVLVMMRSKELKTKIYSHADSLTQLVASGNTTGLTRHQSVQDIGQRVIGACKQCMLLVAMEMETLLTSVIDRLDSLEKVVACLLSVTAGSQSLCLAPCLLSCLSPCLVRQWSWFVRQLVMGFG